eukprot:1157984-Pelagomonas_calceolata.AAC.4
MAYLSLPGARASAAIACFGQGPHHPAPLQRDTLSFSRLEHGIEAVDANDYPGMLMLAPASTSISTRWNEMQGRKCLRISALDTKHTCVTITRRIGTGMVGYVCTQSLKNEHKRAPGRICASRRAT